MAIFQLFCTVDEVLSDLNNQTVNVARLYKAIRDASDEHAREIGEFIPVLRTVKLRGPGGDGKNPYARTILVRGPGSTVLQVPPLLSVTTIVNGLFATPAYVLKPDNGFWPNGPYTWLEIDLYTTTASGWDFTRPDSVQITGLWGRYNKTENTGAVVNSNQLAGDTTLTVDNGAHLSPGAQLLIESEQELVTGYSNPVSSGATLSVGMDVSSDLITVNDGTKLNVGEIYRIDFEQIKIKEIQANQAAVIRGWNATSRSAHTASTALEAYRVFTVERAVNGTTAATHTSTLGILRYVAPEYINYLTRESAIMKYQKASTGFSGKGGNTDTGEVYYYNSAPMYDVEKAKKLFSLPGRMAS